ncbi:MAG: SDR family oxidoreductase [Candidatus Paceibacterota bacterium]
MDILILGGDGMLGHQLLKSLSHKHYVKATIHGPEMFGRINTFPYVDVTNTDHLTEILSEFHPKVVINAVGFVKQRFHDYVKNIEVNALFPHKLNNLCKSIHARLIHISTDCVFSGNNSSYTEQHTPDPVDIYGMTKLLGEIHSSYGCLTLRTSFIGRELKNKLGLLEWFLGQTGTSVNGYINAVFSGLTTIEFGRVIEMILDSHELHGLLNVSGYPINKYDLLLKLRAKFNLNIDIKPCMEPVINRSLDSSKFMKRFNYQPPTWDSLIEEL